MPETSFVCPKCGTAARSAKELVSGTPIRCPSCKVVFNYEPVAQAAPAKPRPSAVTSQPASAPSARNEPRPSSRRRDDDDYDDDRPRRRPKKSSSGTPVLLIVGIVAVLVIAVAGAAIGIVALSSGKDKDKSAVVTNTSPAAPVNVASNQPNPRVPGPGVPMGVPGGPSTK